MPAPLSLPLNRRAPAPYFHPLFKIFQIPPSGGGNQNLLPPFKKGEGGRGGGGGGPHYVWHDCSTIGGHSYLQMMVACIYDLACYFTDIEFRQKYNELVNIQSIVETPMIYILARCSSNDQQLLYSEERFGDILKPQISVKPQINRDN